MTAGKTVSAKITRPGLSGVVQRKRLFVLLDNAMRKPVIWIASPAGSGKTTLISSYLDSRKFPCIWYQCDEGDSDLPTFFSYMGLAAKKAAPRVRKPLPLLTPEYLSGIPIFTRRYFEKLYSLLTTRSGSRIKQPGFFIVLDNYQDVPVNSPFQEMIANGFDIIPDGVHFVVISRKDPPAVFARLQANEKINLLEYSSIRFTFEESKELARGHVPGLDHKFIKEMHEKTEGWAAGIILIIERARLEGAGTESATDFAYERIFDYFAGEIFNKTEKGVQDFLLKTAFLPVLSIPLAEKLTGEGNTGRILAALNRHHYFTERLSVSEQSYRYHQLFNKFLLSRATKKFTGDEVRQIRRKASALLEEAGRSEDAAGLAMEAADWENLAELIVKTAPVLIAEGRYRTLGEWLGRIPDEFINTRSWLLYWKGAYLLPGNPANSRKSFEAAYELFKKEDNKSGLFLTWSCIVDTFLYECQDFHPLDRWIAELESLIHHYKGFDSRQIEDLITSRMFCALMFRQPHHPDLPHWKEKAEMVMNNSPDKAQSLFIGNNLVIYNLWVGRVNDAGLIVNLLSPRFTVASSRSLPHLMWLRAVALYYIYAASYEKAKETITRGLSIAEETGIHLLDLVFFGEAIYCYIATEDDNSAEDYLRKIESARNSVSCYENIYYHNQASLIASHKGDVPLAVAHAEECLRLTKTAGFPFMEGIQHYAVATFLIQAGKYDAVPGHIAAIRKIGSASHSAMLEMTAFFLEAFLAMERQDNRKFIHYARRAFALSRETGIRTTIYQADTHRTCIKALEEGIDVDYVQELIRLHNIVPDKSHFYSENWPWPLKILTLGSFELIKDDKPVTVTSKVKKPLELLKALLAFGGENVPEERLIDALWSDADGDLAHMSFYTTLHRLRKLIDNDKVLQFQSGSLSLDHRYCWLDTKALDHCYAEIEYSLKGGGKQEDEQVMAHLFERASFLYRGEFLSSDTKLHWAVSMREQMKSRYIKIIGTAGKYWARLEQWDKATAWFQKGIEVDSLAEEFYQWLMVCYQKQGQTAQSVKTYQQCCSVLSAALDLGPSPKTKEIYRAIVQHQ